MFSAPAALFFDKLVLVVGELRDEARRMKAFKEITGYQPSFGEIENGKILCGDFIATPGIPVSRL